MKVSNIQKELFYQRYYMPFKKKKEPKKKTDIPKVDTVEVSSKARYLYQTKKMFN